MHENAFMEMINSICAKDGRYAPDAYVFVRQALDITVKALDKPRQGAGRHVKGQELLEGIRTHALQEFGPIARTVFRTWGVHTTEDFGEIVFNLVENGVLGKTDGDSKGDFKNGYDFQDAFVTPFLPQSADEPDARERGIPGGRGRGGTRQG